MKFSANQTILELELEYIFYYYPGSTENSTLGFIGICHLIPIEYIRKVLECQVVSVIAFLYSKHEIECRCYLITLLQLTIQYSYYSQNFKLFLPLKIFSVL